MTNWPFATESSLIDVRLPRLLHKAAFQRTFASAGLLAAAMMILTAFIYWQTVVYLRRQIDTHLLTDARSLASDPGPQLKVRLARALAADPGGMRVGAIFDHAGLPLAGNLTQPPEPLPPLGTIGPVRDPVGRALPGTGTVRVARFSLPGGGYLVFGRRVGELDRFNHIISRALTLALVPLTGLALVGGVLLSRFTTRRVEAVERACRRVMSGRLDERLPLNGKGEFHAFSLMVNRMLDEIERLMLELKSAGDAAAHDLRTPLTRLRARIDRLMNDDVSPSNMKVVLEKIVVDVDLLLAMTSAVLRLSEIESGRRRAGFRDVDVAEIVRSVVDFYSVIAEEKGIGFSTRLSEVPPNFGDDTLLFEAISNLVDNAIKFTPVPGSVRLELSATRAACIVAVFDTGPGIPESQRNAVLRRFYRTDPARNAPGTGLGLSIVDAIVRLHGGSLNIGAAAGGSGCHVELLVPYDTFAFQGKERDAQRDVHAQHGA